MRAPPPPRSIVPALAAVAGVVVAHAVDYLVVFPQADQRAAQLHATGHAYWPVAVGAALAAAAVAVMLAAGRGARRATGTGNKPGPGWISLSWVLAWQVVAFVVMEAGERAMASLPPSVLLHSPVFWFGLVVQLPVAWLATRLLGVAEHAAFRLVSGLRRRPPRRLRPLPVPLALAVPATARVGTPARPRAPPVPVCNI